MPQDNFHSLSPVFARLRLKHGKNLGQHIVIVRFTKRLSTEGKESFEIFKEIAS